MVIGGGEIYAETIGLADRLYVTHVDAAPEGDTRFPAIDPTVWREAVAARPCRPAQRTARHRPSSVYERAEARTPAVEPVRIPSVGAADFSLARRAGAAPR